MSDEPTRSDVRRVECPECHAEPGEPCRNSRGERREQNHQGRVEVFKRQGHLLDNVRELRPYDREPDPVPEVYQHEAPPSPDEQDGYRIHRYDARTRAVGLAGVARARAILAERQEARGGVRGPHVEVQREFVRKAQEASARWHERGCPPPQGAPS